MAAASKKTHVRIANHAAAAHADPVAGARIELLETGDAVKHASRALVLAQRRSEDARTALQRAVEDRELAERV